VGVDASLAQGLVRLSTGHPAAAVINMAFGPLQVRAVTKAVATAETA
jgi:hypothetical protein